MKNVEGAQELAAQGKLLFGTTDTWILWNLTGSPIVPASRRSCFVCLCALARAGEPHPVLCTVFRSTGGMVHATDYSNASATGLYDTFELGWNQQLFSVVGLPPSIFPEVRTPRTLHLWRRIALSLPATNEQSD
jgi:glycerol kinase